MDRGPDSWYHLPVDWAVVNEITNGTSDTTFSPKDGCTREQVVTFLYQFDKDLFDFMSENEPEVKDVTNPFKDVTEKDYSFNAVLWAVSNEVTNGRTDDTFAPKETCKRAEVVTFLYRAIAE